MRRRHFLGMLPAAACLGSRAGIADEQAAGETASGFIRRLGHEIPEVVKGAATDEEKRIRLQPFLARAVAVEKVARFCLGRFWRLATPAQQKEFYQLFLRMLTRAVAARVGLYEADSHTVTLLPEAVRPDGIYVPTIVQSPGEAPVRVTWVVDPDIRPYCIIDVLVEGISMRLSQRSDYNSFLSRHGGDMDLFLRTLREHVS